MSQHKNQIFESVGTSVGQPTLGACTVGVVWVARHQRGASPTENHVIFVPTATLACEEILCQVSAYSLEGFKVKYLILSGRSTTRELGQVPMMAGVDNKCN